MWLAAVSCSTTKLLGWPQAFRRSSRVVSWFFSVLSRTAASSHSCRKSASFRRAKPSCS